MGEDLPVYDPYKIVDILQPFKTAFINSDNWRGMHMLQDTGRFFIIDKYVSGYYRAAFNAVNDRTIFNTGNSIGPNIGDLVHNTNIELSFLLNNYSPNLFSGYNQINDYQDSIALQTYVSGKIRAQSSGLFGHYCGGPYRWPWTTSPNASTGDLYYRAQDTDENRMILVEDGEGHMPFYDYDQICANGSTADEYTKFEFRRFVSSQEATLQAYRFYPLTKATAFCDVDGRDCGSPGPGVNFGPRNDGAADSAVYFEAQNSGSGIRLPPSLLRQLMQNDDFTISFWMKTIEPNRLKYDRYPLQSDLWQTAFFATEQNLTPTLGLVVNGGDLYHGPSTGHIGLLRSLTDINKTRRGWVQWLTDPVRITKPVGSVDDQPVWVYVVLVYERNRTQVYTYTPDLYYRGEGVNGRLAVTRYNFFTTDDYYLAPIAEWGIGAPGNMQDVRYVSGVNAMSDLALFEDALTEPQVRDLINAAIIHDVPIFN